MNGYFKRMGQLARAGAPRHARAGPLSPQTPTLEAVSVEVPVTDSMPLTAPADAPTQSAERQVGPAVPTSRSPTLLPRTDSGDHTAGSQPSRRDRGLKNGSSPVDAPTQKASDPASSLSGQEVIDPAHISETLRNPLESSPGPKVEGVMPGEGVLPRTQIARDTSVALGPTRDETVVEGMQVHIEELTAPEIPSKAQAIEDRTTPVPQTLNQVRAELTTSIPELAADTLFLPEPQGEAKSVDASRRMYSDDTPPSPLLAARKTKSDIEVNIGAITLSLDPEPQVVPASAPAPRPVPMPRAGGIWSDGRGLARSYLRRV